MGACVLPDNTVVKDPTRLEQYLREAARAWHEADECRPLRELRQAAVTCNGVLIEAE